MEAAAAPIRLLAVEDEPNHRRLLELLFRGIGFHVVAVPSGEKALECIDGSFDAMTVDAALPGMSGFDLSRIVRARFPLLPIIFLTAMVRQSDRQMAFECGADVFIDKPVLPAEILSEVASAVEQARRARTGARADGPS